MDPDRRNVNRKPIVQEVMLVHEKGHRLCKVHDISETGVLLEIGWAVLTSDVPVEIIIELPVNKKMTPHHVPGKVARVSTVGTAIEFTNLDGQTRKALLDYLETGNTQQEP